MADTPFTVRVRTAVIEQTERTRSSSKADIERLIEESESKIVSLESLELREREHACVAALRYLMSPIRTLPVELLTEIFGLAIHDDTHIEDAFRVSQVCSDWRRVAHCTPELWNRNFRVDIAGGDSDEFYADGLKDWLARSAPLPVPITWCGRQWEIIRCRSSEEVLRIAPRWCSLDFEFTAPRWLVSRLSECQLESLEALALTIPADSDPSAVLAFTVPRLRKLSLRIRSDALPILSLPWAQLADFTFACHRTWSQPNIAFDLLSQCSNLVRASVFTGLVLPGAARDALSLRHLCSLSVYYFGPVGHIAGHGASFLDNLSAPSLEELCLGFGKMSSQSPRWAEAHFPAFQLRVPNITALELQYSTITSDELKDALSHTPCLERLILRHCECCFDALIGALCYEDGVQPLVPRLHSLHLQDSQIYDESTDIMGSMLTDSADIMAKMLTSRWWTDAKLASNPVPPPVARWTLVRLDGHLESRFVNIMAGLQRKGIPLEVNALRVLR
ncbi:hypothetical protein DFH08DRAFT_1071913 [Mycena albidolilacea]|uniref:F-box domain-containing protein n=1 Tax=Mycena albidolilacea TaxID=1033008 RepID=A0AAD7AR14_9AGAR|nr:hypothetical protein DFH08DRAFT_1071913 [Mycena albidolilacea]